MASFVPRCIAFMQHEKRKFVKKLDHLTSPGRLSGGGSREAAGLRPGGVNVVITDKAVMRMDPDTGEMYLDACCPGATSEEILANMLFSVDTDRAREAEPPTEKEFKTLRQKCDPQRLILG